MIDLNELRLALTEALADELGTYTFSGELTAPAICPDDPNEQEAEVEGLEVVIQQAIDVPITPLLSGDYQQEWATAIVLKQWDTEKTTLVAMHLVLEALAEFNVGVTGVRRVVRSGKLKNIETCTVSFTETEVISV